MSIETDLEKKLDHKIRQAVVDYLSLCDVVDIPLSRAMPGALAVLVHVTARIAQGTSGTMTANDFAGVCHEAFELCESYEKKEVRRERGE